MGISDRPLLKVMNPRKYNDLFHYESLDKFAQESIMQKRMN